MKLPVLASLFLLTPNVRADILFVDKDGGADYLQIQEAIEAAKDGDTILVAPTGGFGYHPFSIADRDLRIVSSELGTHVRVAGQIVVRDLSPGKQLVLGRIRAYGSWPDTVPTLLVDSCSGSVRIEECLIDGFATEWSPAVRVSQSGNVSIVDSKLRGGPGIEDSPGELDGGDGLEIIGSSVAITDCALEGGLGEDSWWDPQFDGYGGAGLTVFSSSATSVYASGTSFVGGPSDTGTPGYAVANGSSADDVRLHDNAYVGGIYGAVTYLPGEARILRGPVFEPDGVSTMRVSGRPGEQVTLIWSTRADFRFVTKWVGVLLIPPPFGFEDGGWTVGGGGEVEFTWQPPAPATGDGHAIYVQAFLEGGGGKRRLTNVISTVVVDLP